MNIFILHEDPAIAASYHCDQHLGKMILESAQMLSTALHKIAPQNPMLAKIYKPAYHNHPCTLWAGESYDNFLWLIDLAYSLQSYLPKRHKSADIIKTCELLARPIQSSFPSFSRTPFALAMPEEIKYSTKFLTATEKYHELYRYKAQDWALAGRSMTYSQFGYRPIPEFIQPTLARLDRTTY